MIELKDLAGQHVLDGVDFLDEKLGTNDFPQDEVAQIIKFRLDGKIYRAQEDPVDNYRSCMKDIKVVSGKIKNIFPAQVENMMRQMMFLNLEV